MDIVTILQNVPTAIGYVIVAYILGKSGLAIVRVIADAVASRMNAKTRIIELEAETKTAEANAKTRAIELEAQGRTRVAEIEAEAKIKDADARLEIAKMQSVAQKETIDDKAKLATELETYRAQSDVTRLAQAKALQETARALVKLSIGQNTTEATVKGAESRLGAKVESVTGDVIAGIEEYMDFSVVYWGMLVENPTASRERLARAKAAWGEGDMQKMQDVADEDVPKAPAVNAPDTEGDLKIASGQ
jgi:hypothetical protein